MPSRSALTISIHELPQSPIRLSLRPIIDKGYRDTDCPPIRVKHLVNRLPYPLFRFLANRLSPAGPKARLSILIFHRVLPEIDPLFPGQATVESFDAQLDLLKSVFNVLPLPEAVSQLKAGTLPARSAAITFDDGYADNVTNALPILQKHGLHATFFIATSYLNGGRMFNDTVIESVRRSPLTRLDLNDLDLGAHELDSDVAKAKAIGKILPQVKYLPLDVREDTVAQVVTRAGVGSLPDDLMMTTSQLKTLHAAGMEIGGHTHRHPILAKLDPNTVRDEIVAGKIWLEDTLCTPVRVFAYPNGKPGSDYLPEQADIVRELGFEGAVSTQRGVSTRPSDVFQLPRFTPWDVNQTAYALRLLQNIVTG
ncbi:MAG: polysaccharide deacetylase family protein [Thiobacillus sp.]|nr:polysaccharide deacetylase family protein [Thiobacillus sp.]